MLFTSPAFLFLFLPLAVLFYLACGKGRRRVCLLIICAAFYLLQNLPSPENLPILPLMTLYTFLSGRLVEKHRHGAVVFTACIFPYAAVILFRNFAYFELSGFTYPVGLTIMAMGSTSYLLETARGTAVRRGKLWHLFLYLGFFPVLIAGPFIKYNDFLKLTSEERVDFKLHNFAAGARLFAIGFIKRLAIGAVLLETFAGFTQRLAGTADPMMGIFTLILIYFGVYFTITGYSDMGCGLCRMFGLDLRYAPTTPFRAATPEEYFHSLLYTLRDWLDDYVIRPILRISKGRMPHLTRALVYGCCLLLFVRSSLYVLALALPAVLLEYVTLRTGLGERLKGHSGVRILCTLPTMVCAAMTWLVVTMGDFRSIFLYLSQLTFADSEYLMDLMLITFSGAKYVFVIVVGLLLLLPGLGGRHLIRRLSPGGQATVRYLSMVTVFTLFTFTILFFLPQFSCYDTLPFRYVFI